MQRLLVRFIWSEHLKLLPPSNRCGMVCAWITDQAHDLLGDRKGDSVGQIASAGISIESVKRMMATIENLISPKIKEDTKRK